jgi:Aspartate oxidase
VYERIDADVLVIGSGLAGLAAALLASRHGRVVLVTKGRLGVGNSRLAQGGLAAALAEDDSPAFHAADTLRAGQGLCDPQAVQTLVARGPGVVRLLAELGVPFDVDAQGNLLLGREGAHTRRRIVHAGAMPPAAPSSMRCAYGCAPTTGSPCAKASGLPSSW